MALLRKGVVAQVGGELGNRLVVGRDHAALTGGDDLVGIEAEAGYIAQTTDAPTFILCPMRFGGILHYVEAVLLSEGPNRFHIDGVTVRVDGHDPEAVAGAIAAARESDTPSLIACKTTIGYGAPTKAGTSATHGAALGEEEIAGTRKALGWTAAPFEIPEDVLANWRAAGTRGADDFAAWTARHGKSAQATAFAIYLARTGSSKADIKQQLGERFSYDLDRSLDEIRPGYRFDVSCQGSVPESIIAFLESNDVEDAIRKAISLGGDSDTMACVAGGIAQAFYKEIPPAIVSGVRPRLPDEFLHIVDAFNARYGL